MPKHNLIYFVLMVITLFAVKFYFERDKESVESDAIKELGKLYAGLKHPVTEYKFFSTGHPYTWTEYSKGDIESRVKAACDKWSPGVLFSIYDAPNYQIKIDDTAKRIFIVFEKKDFDFNSLKVYEPSQ